MAGECSKKQTDGLYQLCISALAGHLTKSRSHRDELRTVPDNVLIDLYYEMCKEDRICILCNELSDLDVFERVLKAAGSQLRLLQCFQAVILHGCKLSVELASLYLQRCDRHTTLATSAERREHTYQTDKLIHLGLRLGGFLNDAGWYADAERVLLACRDICLAGPRSARNRALTLECCHRLLYTQAAYSCFPGAAETYALSLSLLGITESPLSSCCSTSSMDNLPLCGPDKLPFSDCPQLRSTAQQTDSISDFDDWTQPNADVRVQAEAVEGMDNLLPRLYKEFSGLFFVRSDYSAAYKWSTEALKLLKPTTPVKITVDVLRICGKACVVNREFRRAGLLMRQAVALARVAFGPKHPKYAFALLDYGFYLLNIDFILHSVTVYEEALSALRAVFGRGSLHVAAAQEDLAYALYVHEYSSGRFYKAREHAEKAIKVMEKLVPSEHLMLASAKRVKALILEEIALDTPPGQDVGCKELLEESERLHRAALELSLMAFGEKNVQTAKHYGNLGRLYQSMQKYEDAEAMHLKAIAIKEEILGSEDYEVGLSIGHLASLYNYHMSMYAAAEKLYFRSISISLKLFGKRYSGLEYDYRGLVHVFTHLKKFDRAQFYNDRLHQWKTLRELPTAEQHPALGKEQAVHIEELKQQFFRPNEE